MGTQWARINLANNQLTGTIPSTIDSNRKLLKTLNLAGNQLSGSIPLYLNNCTTCQSLILENNQLSGVINDEFALKITNLYTIRLANNLLSGNIPNAIFSFPNPIGIADSVIDLSGIFYLFLKFLYLN